MYIYASPTNLLIHHLNTLQMGSSLEMQFGSIPFLILTSWAVVVIGLTYVGISYILWSITDDFSHMQTSGVGYSGVLFMYAILEAYHTRIENQSFFGVCTVPARIYPFVLMFAIQFIMPGISFLGHLSGVLVGLLTVYGVSEKIFLPSLEFSQKMESWGCCACLVNSAGYVRCGDFTSSTWAVASGSGTSGVCASLWGAIVIVWGYFTNILSTLMYIVGCPVERLALQATACSTGCISKVKVLLSPVLSAFSSSGDAGLDVDMDTSMHTRGGSSPGGGRAGHVLGGGSSSSPRYARLGQSDHAPLAASVDKDAMLEV